MASPRAKIPPYLLLLLIAFALVGIIGFQTLKERRSSSDLIKEMDTEIEKLEEQLQAERNKLIELQRELKKSNLHQEKLNNEKDGLNKQLIDMEHSKSSAEDDRKRLESSLQDKENEISDLREKLKIVDEKGEEVKVLKEKLAQKESYILALQMHHELSNETKEQQERENESRVTPEKQDSISQKGVLIDGTGVGMSNNTEQREHNHQNEENEGMGKGRTDDKENTQEVVQGNTDAEAERTVGREEENSSSNKALEVAEAERSEDDDTDDQFDADIGVFNKADLEDAAM